MLSQTGLSVVPVGPDKRPLVTQWKALQEEPATEDQVRDWFTDDVEALGLVLGAVSDNIVAIDFDNREFHRLVMEQVGAGHYPEVAGLVNRIREGYTESTPKGVHWLFGVPQPVGSRKLANDSQGKVLCELRGEKSYLVTAPSRTEGGEYELLHGGFDSIAEITEEEFDLLLKFLSSFNQAVAASGLRALSDWEKPVKTGGGHRPGDDFNERATWDEILLPLGWTQIGKHRGIRYWRRPGKSSGHSATTGVRGENGPDVLWAFTSSTALEQDSGYRKFSAYAVLHHGGDFSAAAKALRERGYGKAPSYSFNDSGNAGVLYDLHGNDHSGFKRPTMPTGGTGRARIGLSHRTT